MTPLKNWDPCLAGMARDVAFFDGITIETDRITDPRWDRVLGILEEEQVLMCRMMAPLLRARLAANPNLLVADIGTGSGVFALCAAKLGCAVVAIDISQRALRFARENARTNRVAVSTGAPKPGEIQFLNCSYEDLPGDGMYDVVIIAPPYNPTVKGFRPALHADAGPLGQRCFLEQLPHAARLLKNDGVCVGNQMMVVDAAGSFEALPEIERQFPGGELRYLRILPSDIPVDDFLRGQYASYLKEKLNLRPGLEAIEGHIETHARGRHFALVYLELKPRGRVGAPAGVVSVALKETIDSARPPSSWQERVKLHRKIIEHTSLEHSFPAPALFLETDAVPDFPVRDPGLGQSEAHWADSVLRHVDAWLAKSALLDPQDGEFDLLLVDTAPWYPTPEGRKGLMQESAVWAAKSQTDSIRLESADGARRLLALYQDNTARLQRTQIGPFLHPHFTGQWSPASWRGVHFSVREGLRTQSRPVERAPQKGLSPEARAVEDLFGELNEELLDAKKVGELQGRVLETPTLTEFAQSFYMQQRLDELDVPANTLRQYVEHVEARVRKLNSDLGVEGVPDEMLRSLDLDSCHLAMHRRLDKLVEDAGITVSGSSTLIGIPVSMGSSDTHTSEYSLPDNYRGGIWVYAVARGAWHPGEERSLLDFARLLYMLYEGRYAQLAGKELLRVGRDQAQIDSTHETKHLVAALREWPRDPVAFGFRRPDQGFSERPSEDGDYAILPFRKLFDAGMAQIQMWAMAPDSSDLPFLEGDDKNLPHTVRDLVQKCYSSARDGFLIRMFRKLAIFPEYMESLQQTCTSLQEAMPKLAVDGDSLDLAPNWRSGVSEEEKFWMNLSRVMLCEFREALQHGDWTCARGINVRVESRCGGISNVTFSNTPRGVKAFEENIKHVYFDPVLRINSASVAVAFTAPIAGRGRSNRNGGEGTGVRANLARALRATLSFPSKGNKSFQTRYEWRDPE